MSNITCESPKGKTQNQKRLRNMTDIFIPACLDDAGMTPAQFRVFCRVARRGVCYESIASMAKGCRMNAKTVRAALKELAVAGLILKTERDGLTFIYEAANPSQKNPWVKTGDEGNPHKEGKRQKETGVSLRCNASFSKASKSKATQSNRRPTSIIEVLQFSLTRRGFVTSQVESWLAQLRFDVPADEILAAVSDEAMREAMNLAFRFAHFNNRAGWSVTRSWRAAYEGFEEKALLDGHVAAVPRDWLPHIAGMDDWPDSEAELEEIPI